MKFIVLLVFNFLAMLWVCQAQNTVITGQITDEQNNLPMAGVSVVLKGTTIGTSSNEHGKFTINNAPRAILIFSFVNYTTIEIPVNNRSVVNVVLAPQIGVLGDVLVIGYGTQKKKDLTGSIASVSPDQYKDQPVLNTTSALQGRVAGLQITNTSGAPGSEAKILIRGANSINSSNAPLYVVDGIALASFGLQDINVNDIKSMEVLKDASATAVYGSRGANGVILITTKSGSSSGEPRVEYNGFLSFNSPMKKYDLRDPVKFAEEANYIAGANVFPNPSDFAGKGTDWQKQIFQNGRTQSHQLSVSGGNDKTRYYVSGYYVDQSGLLKNTNQSKFALRANLESKISSKASFTLGLMANRSNSKNTGDIGGKGNPVTGALAWAPTEPVYDSLNLYNRNAVSPIWQNPYMVLQERNSELFSNSALMNGKLRYSFTDWLSLDVVLGLNLNNSRAAYLNNDWISPGNPGSGQSHSENYTFQNSNILTFHKVVKEKHDITFVGLEETSANQFNSFNALGSGLSSTSNGYYNLGLNSSQAISSTYSNWSLISFMGRLSYAYNDKYLLAATFRADGSSKFQKAANKWGYFPSVAVGWRLSKEDFIKDLNVFSSLKLRASYGLTGNQGIDPYSSLGLLTPVQYSFGTTSLSQGYMQGNPSNPNLKWETTKQFDIGLDMSFWNNRVNITADYYSKKTDDLLLNTPIAGYDGGGVALQNIGAVSNNGFEFSIGVTPVQTDNFSWTTNFNVSVYKNTVLSLGKDSILYRNDFVGQGFINTNIQVVKVGKSMGTFYLIPWNGVYNSDDPTLGYKAGDNRYQDVNHDGSIDFGDRVIQGNAMPKALLGWNNTLSYHNFELNMFFQASVGNKIFNSTYAIIAAPNSDVIYPTLAASTNYWSSNSTGGTWANPASKTGRNFTESTQYLQDGSYYRLKNISLSYTMPHKVLKLDATLNISAQNLFTITKYKGFDPEASSLPAGSDASAGIDFGAYPSPKTFSVALRLGF